MTHESLVSEDWDWTIDRLGGMDRLVRSARETRAFLRAREIASALDLLRLFLAYCLGRSGLRGIAGWAEATGLARVSDVALLGRFRNMGAWLSSLIGFVLEQGRPEAAKGR